LFDAHIRRSEVLIQDYFGAISSVIARIAEREADSIAAAADACAESIANGGVVHMHDSGHMLNSELVHRAGGLVGLTPFTFGMSVNNPNLFRDKEPKPDLGAETIALAIKSSNLRAGDVLFIGSVSGKASSVVELALQAKAAGIKVIGVTSLTYSRELKSLHSSGKKLYEVADLVIDNNAPYGDAMLEVPGLEMRACPASGIAAACIMWAVVAGIIERLIAMGKTPSVYRSANAPGGMEDLNVQKGRYKELGY
jgi:uncharacterized phosphosugar-binding protein